MVDLFKLILQIVVVLLTSRIVGMAFKTIRQPQVMGEMAAGIMLGPSLLGWLAPAASKMLFPAASLGYLNALSQVGLVLFMFLVGLALNPKELHEHGHAAVLTSHVSIVTPFCLGSLAALFMYPRLSDDSMSFMGFALFMGSAMSITAFPVLARILTERHLLRTRMGTLGIACAAVDGLVHPRLYHPAGSKHTRCAPHLADAGRTAGVRSVDDAWREAPAHALRNVVPSERQAERERHCGHGLVGPGIRADHRVPGHSPVVWRLSDGRDHAQEQRLHCARPAETRVDDGGLRTRIDVSGTANWWLYAGIVIVVAIAGKLGGSMLAARFAGMPWRDATSLGILMNTRGLMELVILNIGLDIGVISPAVFSMMVLMALVTTFMTTPLLEWAYPAHLMRAAEPEQELAAEQVA